MAAKCEFCKKGPTIGNNVTRRGIAKSKGGIGRRVTGRSKRRYEANVQKVRVVVKGTAQRVKVCTRCMKTMLGNGQMTKRPRGAHGAAQTDAA
ncbi:MAG: 50S ribosomal protein L28 [Planctomycetes bacterium]|nr:50S ribosomal protein L28 [Planctomycetota bacterium]